MVRNMTKAQAVEITGAGLSNPSKMPGFAYGVPATACHTGAKLVNVQGSVCENCYALKHAYLWKTVKSAYQRRLESLENPLWVEAMVYLITSSKTEFFRWQDSGDLQSVAHLGKIVDVCNRLPEVKFWLPTREYKMVTDYVKQGGKIPSNLVIRLSAHMKNAAPPSGYGFCTSTVHTSEENEPKTHICRAYQHNNECGSCRACWDASVPNVSYLEH